jgi:hypothetical protein
LQRWTQAARSRQATPDQFKAKAINFVATDDGKTVGERQNDVENRRQWEWGQIGFQQRRLDASHLPGTQPGNDVHKTLSKKRPETKRQ